MLPRPVALRAMLVLLTTALAAAGAIPHTIAVGAADADRKQEIPEFNRDPARARLIADDLERFWRAWDRAAENPDQRRSIFQSEYLDAGSPGLQAFVDLRIGGVDQLLATIDAHPRYYASLRAQMPKIRAMAEPVQELLYRLQELLPKAVFPPTYLMVGVMNTGGTIHFDGLLIGVEMYGKTPDTPTDELGRWHQAVIGAPEDIVAIIAHEMIHFQQLALTRAAPPTTLLGLSLYEGAADFVAELLAGRHVNHHIHEWAMPREVELWTEFRKVMHGEEYGDWLYSGEIDADRPADLGYFIGYRIVQAFFGKAEDKKAVLRDILSMTDAEEFLRLSGYEQRMTSRTR
jgi:hypothetical protein